MSEIDHELISIPRTEVIHENGSRHAVESFRIARRAVTVADFRRFAKETGYKTTAETSGDDDNYHHHYAIEDLCETELMNSVATMVSWIDANAYCRWRGGVLPSENEWLAASVRDWNTVVPYIPGIEAQELLYAQDAKNILLAGSEWTRSLGEGGEPLVRSHPRYFLVQGWTQRPRKNVNEISRTIYSPVTCFRVAYPPELPRE